MLEGSIQAWPLAPVPHVCPAGEVTVHPGAGMGAQLSSPQADVRMSGEGPAVKPERAAAGRGSAN